MPAETHFYTSIAAAVLLLGRDLAAWPDSPTTDEILERTGAGRSQAYAMMARLKELLPTLVGKPGRPTSASAPANSELAVCRCIQQYLMRHPGSAYFDRDRYHYLDDFRRFIVGLVAPGQPGEGMTVAQLAEASSLPLGTLKSWFSQQDLAEQVTLPEPKASSAQLIRQEHQHHIITLYQSWKGTFVAFCRMVREEHRLNYGTTAIGTLLEQAGIRQRKKSKSVDQNRGSYRQLFPGAQWLGDGSTMKVHNISVQWGKETFFFNLEAMLDVSSNAVVGVAISDSEDEAVVLEAFQDGLATTRRAPLSLSLDNRPSNHTQAVTEATQIKGTTLLCTTPGRPQSKAPLEGTFGLFKQCLPELVVCGIRARERARSVLELVFTAWARGRNGKPRKNLGNNSPADYYREANPTPADIAEARRRINEERQRQDAIRRTREERADQVKLQFLKQALSDLNIADPGDRLAVDLAYFPRDAIVDGIGIYQAKERLGTIPSGVDPGRYLRGIIHNIYEQAELTLATEFHISNRLRLRDLSLRGLTQQAEQLLQQCSTTEQLLPALIDRALAASHIIDYHFWALRCVASISDLPIDRRTPLYRSAGLRIAASFRADRTRKQSLLARLARVLSE